MEISGSYGGIAFAGENPVINGSGPPPFISKIYVMVDDPVTDSIVSWGPGNNTFVVWKPLEFARDLLPKYFKHNNFASFVRQLNTYGFRKIDPDRWEFANEGFLRGQKPLLTHINRRKSSHAHNQSQSIHHNASFTSCVEMGKFWLDEDIGRLKRDKNILMQELLRLRQQQQTTDTLLRALTKYTQKMEQHQQKMLSFLSKAIQNPELLAQLVQLKSSNNQIPGGNKKRRYPIQKEFEREITSSDGQIINYQRALLTDAAKSTLMQILNSDKSDSFSKPECVAQHGNFHLSTDSINNSRIPSGRSSGISLENPPLSSGMSNIPANSGISTIYSSSVISEIQSSLNMSDPGKKISVSRAIDFQECAQLRCILADERIVDIPSISHLESEEIIPFEMENFSGDAEFDIFMAGEDIKLPAVVDSFWENFL